MEAALGEEGETTERQKHIAESIKDIRMRVFMREWAFKAEIPRDMRRYISRWTQEATSDGCTREHSGIVTKIWDKVIPRRELMENLAEVPLDIKDPHYMERPAMPEPLTLEEVGRVIHSLNSIPL